ncbi:MAG TPA: 50S ribosomal protein L11 methyltransferase [Pyrinomonadaceae bacterium]|jgi:ribosomal protein L11 methyltransferase
MSKSVVRQARKWFALDVAIESRALEAVQYALMEAGALGTESRDEMGEATHIVAYFDARPERERVRAALFDALRLYDLPSSSVREMTLADVEDRDWLGEWKKSWQPVAVGRRFIIAPPWSEVAAQADRIVIRIEPGMAFGTGTHETTRLCLSAIEKHFQGGSLLDVGTGTGILAIAAALLSTQSRIEACDTDADAVLIARENARLNNVSERISFHVGTIEETSPSADVVCANLTADVIAPLLPALIGATCGRLILSGILDSQSEMIESRLRELGIGEPLEIAADGEWVAIII